MKFSIEKGKPIQRLVLTPDMRIVICERSTLINMFIDAVERFKNEGKDVTSKTNIGEDTSIVG